MNTLISILVVAFIVLVSLIVGFLGGLHAAKLGMQEIIRDTLIKNKKDEPYGYDCTDSDYDEGDDGDQPYQVWPVASSSSQQLISRKEVGNIHQKHRPSSPSHRTNHTNYHRYSTIPIEQHYTLSGDSLAPHHLFGSSSSSTSTNTRSEVKNDTCSSSVYAGDGTYLARI